MTCSTLCSQPATMHCGELISMKDCGLWATMTYKLSSNFCLVLSAPLCLRRCRAPALTGALKCSPSDQQLRGVGRERERRRGRGGRKKKKKVGVSLAESVPLNLCLSVCIQLMWRLARWKIRLTAIIRVHHYSAPRSSAFVPCAVFSSRGLSLFGVVHSPVVFHSPLIKLVSVTGPPHLKHMVMSVPFTQQLFNV